MPVDYPLPATADGVFHPLPRVKLVREQPNVIALDFSHANAENNAYVVNVCVRMQGIDKKYNDVTAIKYDFCGNLDVAALRSG